MSDKAKTLPRTKRDHSPSPSSKSFSSLKTSFRSINPLRTKKKKKASSVTSADSSEPPTGGSSTQDLNETPELPEDPVGEPDATSTPSVAALDAVQPTQERLKTPKKPKPPMKKIVKGGKGLFSKLKGKNESAAIVVDTPLDLRRGGAPLAKQESDDLPEENAEEQEELKNGDIGEMTITSKDEWSTSATCEKVRKLSRLEIHESMYNEEFQGDGLSDSIIPDEDTFSAADDTTNPSTPEPVTANGDTPNNPISYDKKSPSTIKKDILSSINSSKTRKTSEPITNGSRSSKGRKISMQARNSTDKNELLFKILVIGELGTGKTSIIKRYVHQFFSQHYRATIGVDFALKVLQWDNESMIRLQLWDIAGQERFGNMTRVYYKEAVGAFIVFDVTRVSTFEAVTKWKQDLDAKVQLANGEAIPCVLLANKCDQPKEGIVNNHNKMDEFCKENQFVGWFETSARENINIDEAANCLVAKIVQNDKKRLEEKETTNGTGGMNITLQSGEAKKSKSCNPC